MTDLLTYLLQERHRIPNQVEKLQKAPARIARAMRKNIADWGANHPTAPEWLAVAKLAEAMTPKQVEELFAAGSRTSGDIEGQLERQARQAA